MTTTTEDQILLMDIPMPIETPRLILRPVQTGDGAAITEAKRETWDQLTQWMPWAKGEHSPDADEVWARKNHAQFILRENFALVGIEKDTGRHVIWTGLHRFDWHKRRFEIGYWVRASAQGKGYATESTNALIRYAFNALSARRVEITHADGNERSQNVIEKLSFQKEAEKALDLELPNGTFVTRHDYVRLNTDGLPPLDVRWGAP